MRLQAARLGALHFFTNAMDTASVHHVMGQGPLFDQVLKLAAVKGISDLLREPGAHIGSVGNRAELHEGFTHGTVFVEWAGAAGTPPPAGAVELLHVPADRVVELGAVLSGGHPGRTSADEITVYKSTGHAIEDAAAARLVLDEAVAKGIGLRLPR